MDREKVFDAFRNCITEPKCKDCPWEPCKGFNQTKTIPLDLCLDILKLLKEQEPAMPTWSQGKAYCGKCGQRLPRKRADKEINYCGYCGQAVKWDD